MPTDHATKIESQLLACAYLDGETIDKAVGEGVTSDCFSDHVHRAQWDFLCVLRLAQKPTDTEGVYTAALSAGKLADLGGLERILAASGATPTAANAGNYITAVRDASSQRKSLMVLTHAAREIESGEADVEATKRAGERVMEICTHQQAVRRDIPTIADEAIKDAEELMAGTAPTRTLVTTGLPTFDKYATPMESHEYVVVGARTSHGKSSFLTQVVGHNIAKGLKVALFTLETSDKAVLKQIVAQRAAVNLRQLDRELREKQTEYMDKLRYARTTKNLLIFDRDISLLSLQNRCRQLANSYRPDLVVIDYLGLIGVDGSSQYERTSAVSKAMIPLRKVLGCTLMLGCQLSRGMEKEDREPQRTDFKDSGSIEEDAHRIIALYRAPNQPLDMDYYDSTLFQLKLRDGPLAKVAMKFHAPTTRFMEVQA